MLAVAVSWGPATASAQTKPAPVYSLPADGTWVDYEWALVTTANKNLAGQLRISSVGQKQVQGVPHRWVEIKLTYTMDNQQIIRWRKVLVAETALQKGQALPEAVVEGYKQNGPAGAVLLLPRPQLGDLLGLGFTNPDAAFQDVNAEELVQCKLGKFVSRHVHAVGKDEVDGRTLAYHGWLTKDVPFGWARFEIRELTGGASKTIFTATAVKAGQNAKSEVDETKVSTKR